MIHKSFKEKGTHHKNTSTRVTKGLMLTFRELEQEGQTDLAVLSNSVVSLSLQLEQTIALRECERKNK